MASLTFAQQWPASIWSSSLAWYGSAHASGPTTTATFWAALEQVRAEAAQRAEEQQRELRALHSSHQEQQRELRALVRAEAARRAEEQQRELRALGSSHEELRADLQVLVECMGRHGIEAVGELRRGRLARAERSLSDLLASREIGPRIFEFAGLHLWAAAVEQASTTERRSAEAVQQHRICAVGGETVYGGPFDRWLRASKSFDPASCTWTAFSSQAASKAPAPEKAPPEKAEVGGKPNQELRRQQLLASDKTKPLQEVQEAQKTLTPEEQRQEQLREEARNAWRAQKVDTILEPSQPFVDKANPLINLFLAVRPDYTDAELLGVQEKLASIEISSTEALFEQLNKLGPQKFNMKLKSAGKRGMKPETLSMLLAYGKQTLQRRD